MRSAGCEQTRESFDEERARAFAGRVVEILNGGALALMISLGHRAGLFDVLRHLDFAASAEIADEAGLEERYVREWLGAMVTGGIVEYDPLHRTYRLPPEHAASLTREARPGNLAVTAQWIPLLAGVEDPVLACFERGGGVSYRAYGRFHEVMAEQSDQITVASLADGILPLVPGLILALGQGIEVLDIGCGTGRAMNLLAHAFPRSRFTGLDRSAEAVELARAEASSRGLENVGFEVCDVATLDRKDAYHLVTAFDAIHDQAHPDVVLRAVHRALRPGGTFLVQEIAGTSHLQRDVEHPLAPFLYTVSCLHCMTVSLADGGAGLGAMWGEETARRMLGEAGFDDVGVRRLSHDPLNQYFVARKAG